jgi:hypothetical protein
MHAALDTFLPEPLPPPPRRPRLARGSVPPYDLAIDVRVIEPPQTWSRVVPVSPRTGKPLLARDRRPGDDVAPLDRAAAVLLTLLASMTAILAILLV